MSAAPMLTATNINSRSSGLKPNATNRNTPIARIDEPGGQIRAGAALAGLSPHPGFDQHERDNSSGDNPAHDVGAVAEVDDGQRYVDGRHDPEEL